MLSVTPHRSFDAGTYFTRLDSEALSNELSMMHNYA
jgi:hypothetical protein